VTQDAVSLSGVAGRYATALFDLASEKGATEDVAESLAAFQDMITESAELAGLVKSPVFSVDEQQKALNAIFAKTKISGIATNFMQPCSAKRRLLFDMIEAYRRLNDRQKAYRTEVPGSAASPRACIGFASSACERLRRQVGQISMLKTEPSITDGVIVKLVPAVVDASVRRTKLNAIRTRVKEVG